MNQEIFGKGPAEKLLDPISRIGRINASLAASVIGANATIRRLRDAFLELQEAESLLTIYGDAKEIDAAARQLAESTPLSYKEAIVQIISERNNQPVGLLDRDALKTLDSNG